MKPRLLYFPILVLLDSDSGLASQTSQLANQASSKLSTCKIAKLGKPRTQEQTAKIAIRSTQIMLIELGRSLVVFWSFSQILRLLFAVDREHLLKSVKEGYSKQILEASLGSLLVMFHVGMCMLSLEELGWF